MPEINRGILEWIARNRSIATKIILVAGNVYQFLYHREYEEKTRQQLQEINIKSVEYERKRSEKLEALLIKFHDKKIKLDDESND